MYFSDLKIKLSSLDRHQSQELRVVSPFQVEIYVTSLPAATVLTETVILMFERQSQVSLNFDPNWQSFQKKSKYINFWCGNLRILLPLRFDVKSNLAILAAQKLQLWPFQRS